MPDLPVVADSVAPEEVTHTLLATGIGDGLPVVPPTQARLDRMLGGAAELYRSWGAVPPLFGDLTTTSVAYCAVLAGCHAAELPIVLTAARACLAPEFNLLGLQTTTGTAAVAVLIHNAEALAGVELNTGPNCLGPGNRANACVGRAVALVLATIGEAKPGQTDMATTGQPGKYTFCVAEAPDSPFPSLAAQRASAPASAAVTVIGVSGTAEALPRSGGATGASVLDPPAELMAGAALAAGEPDRMLAAEHFLLLPPELATNLAHWGWALPEVQHHLFERASDALSARIGPGWHVASDPKDLHPIVTGGPGVKMLYLPTWIGGTRSITRTITSP